MKTRAKDKLERCDSSEVILIVSDCAEYYLSTLSIFHDISGPERTDSIQPNTPTDFKIKKRIVKDTNSALGKWENNTQ